MTYGINITSSEKETLKKIQNAVIMALRNGNTVVWHTYGNGGVGFCYLDVPEENVIECFNPSEYNRVTDIDPEDLEKEVMEHQDEEAFPDLEESDCYELRGTDGCDVQIIIPRTYYCTPSEICDIAADYCDASTAELTHGSNGYPKGVTRFLTDFSTFEEAQEVAEKFGGEVWQFRRRDGWHFFEPRGWTPVALDPADFDEEADRGAVMRVRDDVWTYVIGVRFDI